MERRRGNRGRSVNGADWPIAHGTAVRRGTGDSPQEQSTGYIAALQETVYGWRFVVTEKGHVGIAPKTARTGNVVAIVKGGRVLFILQESIARPGTFQFVGESYIYGIMGGFILWQLCTAAVGEKIPTYLHVGRAAKF
ncbi:hypothetical protein GGS23DRAFT_574020 [Durotheca rogersii]|uniref:uncharacterized protein n=1 Tax=Durotheca rogersii TaxID=419775 RepID=UPI002220DBAE|nr:uncharacterized protein GGS23DRAFT_574020 [Durotheca rogersii]KAI5861980.1 hypothetical protein GGS23DRAFT_574020 [Durotheca rogersii]